MSEKPTQRTKTMKPRENLKEAIPNERGSIPMAKNPSKQWEKNGVGPLESFSNGEENLNSQMV